MLDQFRQATWKNIEYKKLVDLIREGTMQRYWSEHNLFYIKGVSTRQDLTTARGEHITTIIDYIYALGVSFNRLHCWVSKVDDMNTIIVVIDRFTKYATFMVALTMCATEVLLNSFIEMC